MIRAAALALFMLLPASAWANCRLALLLALDVSSSVDPSEDALQRGGLAKALAAPEVVEAFFAVDQPVALAVYEWSGRAQQKLLLDWTMIRDRATLEAAAQTLANSIRSTADHPTAMGYALTQGARYFKDAPTCDHKTLDMAGDGVNNDGFGPQTAYRTPDFNEITVNGLVVNAADFEGEVGLIAFYRADVLHGPGAFLEIANGFHDYERAIRRKLVRELSPAVIGAAPHMAEPQG